MRLLRNLTLSVRALGAHRVRTALAVAGTAIGVCGVLVLTAVGAGARAEVIRRIENLGRNMLVVSASRLESRAGRSLQGEAWTRELRVADAAALLAGSGLVARAAPAQDQGMVARFGPLMNPTTVLGTTPDWQRIRRYALTRGRFFTAQENDARSRVAVLGASAARNLFADSIDPVGRHIRIGRVRFEVIGVLESKGISVDGNATEDDRIVIPLETALHRVFRLDYIKMIYLEVSDAARMNEAEAEVAAILRARHDPPGGARDDFNIQNQRVILNAELDTQKSFRRLLAGLGFLALLVGGVGILSIMLLSIRERRREIGLRVAVGARQPDVLAQFLTESLILSCTGGITGILLGLAVARVVSTATAWHARVDAATIAIATGSAIAIGITFGVFPAWRAAVLDPIEALRSE